MLSDIDILDGHVHCFASELWPKTFASLRYSGARQFALLDTGNHGHDAKRVQLRNALGVKREMPNEAYVFGGLDFSGLYDRKREPSGSAAGSPTLPDVPFERQLQELIDLGCDGMKLLNGKPDNRKATGAPL